MREDSPLWAAASPSWGCGGGGGNLNIGTEYDQPLFEIPALIFHNNEQQLILSPCSFLSGCFIIATETKLEQRGTKGSTVV